MYTKATDVNSRVPMVTVSLPATLKQRVTQFVCVAFASAVLALPASAQWRVGGFLGGEHDSSWDEFLVIGADARGAVGASGSMEINPRVSYFIRDLTTRLQLDLNIIRPLALAGSSRLSPYVGAGVALERVSYDNDAVESETNPGFNYIVGSTVKTTGRVQPFAQFQYSVLHEAPNSAVVTFGVHVKLGSK